MPYTVSFIDFTPPERFDGVPWTTILIEEAPDPDAGPWTLIDTLTINPTDDDPAAPATRSFTTDQGTISAGWYRVTFKDNVNGTATPTAPVQNVPDETADYVPSVSELGTLMRARTKDNQGNELGTFTENTRPTGEQAAQVLREAADDVMSPIDTSIPPRANRYARAAILYRAAMIVEISYYPEQIGSNRSPFQEYKAMYDQSAVNLAIAVEREREEIQMGEGENLSKLLPYYEFPPTYGWDTKVW